MVGQATQSRHDVGFNEVDIEGTEKGHKLNSQPTEVAQGRRVTIGDGTLEFVRGGAHVQKNATVTNIPLF